MNVVQLLLELEPQFDLIFMVLAVESKLFFQFDSECFFIGGLTFQIFDEFGLLLDIVFECAFTFKLVVEFLLELTFLGLKFSLLDKGQIGEDGLIVTLTTVLCEDGVCSPYVLDNGVVVVCVLQSLFDHLEEAHTVDEQAPVDSVHFLIRNASVGE